jgi:hypothetical protein
VIAAAIPDAMLLPTDEYFAQEVPEPVYNGLSCPKYALWDSNPGHPSTWGLHPVLNFEKYM